MKDRTKFYLAKLMIMVEKDMGYLEENLHSGDLSPLERKGTEVEQLEYAKELAELRKCHDWVLSIQQPDKR